MIYLKVINQFFSFSFYLLYVNIKNLDDKIEIIQIIAFLLVFHNQI